MGVPKFYRWISERYPCLSEIVKEYQIPEFNNLYLDMNGIIHICSHPNDDDPHFRISEEDILKDIFHYIEVLFRMIQPSKVFYMAVDGVAPRAKMNQQRGRRFRTAREAEENERKAVEKGEVLPKDARFDSNCITPGTEFMSKLDAQLQYFVSSKVTHDKLWQNCTIIYSGHKTPGEGEHKIMEYIRYAKSKPDYDPNTRHCLYGLDADLIMLGLTSHEPHFALLREEVRFNRSKKSNKRSNTPEETTFHLLHLSLMREYIAYEFYSLQDTLPFKYDLEAIIDDWVLMGFLVGNDFIPHLPGLHINKDALLVLYETYKEVLPSLDGYLNEGGTLNLRRLETFMAKLTEYDVEKFQELNADLKYLQSKSGAGVEAQVNARMGGMEAFAFDDDLADDAFGSLEGTEGNGALTSKEVRERLSRLDIRQDEDFLDDDEGNSLDDEELQFNAEFRQHKRHYYLTKMLFEEVTPEMLRDQATHYIRGLQWILNYYYNGICSWSWYYPYHYAPYISDIRNFADKTLVFEKGTPFLPYEQLLAVLSPLSVTLLPKPYRKLMLTEDSPLKEFYPKEFATDLNGKQQDWEAVVCIPFINEKLLLESMKECNEELGPEEKSRNSHGPMYIYNYTRENLGEYEAPDYFPNIRVNHAEVKLVWRQEWDVEPSKLIKGLLPGAKTDVYFAGFPTLKHLDHTFRKERAAVKVFQQDSRGDNFILEVTKREMPPIKELIKEVLGHSVFIGWPHLNEVKVVSLFFEDRRYYLKGDNPIPRHEENDKRQKSFWGTVKEDVEAQLMKRWGIDVGETECIIYGKQMSGRNYVFGPGGEVTLEKSWSEDEVPFPLQAVVRDISVFDPGYKQYDSLESYFTPGAKVFMLGYPHYGSMGEVTEVNSQNKRRVGVTFQVREEPDLYGVFSTFRQNSERYMSAAECSSRLGMSPQLFARLTGSVFLAKALELNPFTERDSGSGRLNIGLNLKSNKRGEEVVGFTRKYEGKRWEYSEECLKTLQEYQRLFPEIFAFLNQNTSTNDVYEDEVFPTTYKERVQELSKWLKEASFSSAERCKWGSVFLDPAVVTEISKTVSALEGQRVEAVKMYVEPSLLYKPNNRLQGSTPPDPKVTFELFDRVINVREGFSVPLGAHGTIIGIQPAEREQDKLYVIMFDESFNGGLTLAGETSSSRCYRLNWASMMNLTHGQRKNPNAGFSPMQHYEGTSRAPHYIVKKRERSMPGERFQRSRHSKGAPSVASTLFNNSPKSSVEEEPDRDSPQPPNPSLLPKPFLGLKGVSSNNHRNEQKYEKGTFSAPSNLPLSEGVWDNPSRPRGRGRGRPNASQPLQVYDNIWSQIHQTLGSTPTYMPPHSLPKEGLSPVRPDNPSNGDTVHAAPQDALKQERKEVSVTELFQIASHFKSHSSDSADATTCQSNPPNHQQPNHLHSNANPQHYHHHHQHQQKHHHHHLQQQHHHHHQHQHHLHLQNQHHHHFPQNHTHSPRNYNQMHVDHPPSHLYDSPPHNNSSQSYSKPQGFVARFAQPLTNFPPQNHHGTPFRTTRASTPPKPQDNPNHARFVPTQVARRQTPRKTSCSEDLNARSQRESPQKHPHHHQGPHKADKGPGSNPGDTARAAKPRRRQRNRLAANFAVTEKEVDRKDNG